MWLLDVNMPKKLVNALGELGVEARTTHDLGWDAYSNGTLLEKAASNGYICLLTRDRLFGESASRALNAFRSSRLWS